jgi:5,10-methylenetetrahydromethanopterin reductase
LQKLSAGRFRLGIGVGSNRVLENLGIDTSHPVEGIAETIAVLRPLLAGGIEQHQGPRHTVRNFKLTFEFAPPSIHIGTVGPKMTALAGRLADGVIITTHAPKSLMKQTVDTARAAAQAAGRKPSDINVTAFLIACIRKDPAEAKDLLRPRLAVDIARIARHVPTMAPMFHSAGFGDDKIQALWRAARPEDAAHMIDDSVIDALCFAGDAAAFHRRLVELKALGVDEVVLFQAPEDPQFKTHLDDLVAATKRV